MKLHLAEHDPQHHAWPKHGVDRNNLRLRILLSFHYYQKIDLDDLFQKYFTEPYPDVFIDSGGFSAATQGAEIDIKDYADWVKRYQHLITTYANLDVIGDAETTLDNQHRLEDMGLEPLPVFHTAEPWTYLEDYIEQYSYIALGGLVPFMGQTKKVMPWLIRAFKMAGDKAVYHGFGVTSWKLLMALPWYSVDSSSWGKGFRYGRVPIFDCKAGKFREVILSQPSSARRQEKLIRSLGFNPLDFADKSRYDRAKVCAISALSYMLAERWLRKRHGVITIPDEPEREVLRAHLADANPKRIEEAQTGLRLHLSDTSNGINYGDAEGGTKVFLAETANKVEDIRRARGVLDGCNSDS